MHLCWSLKKLLELVRGVADPLLPPEGVACDGVAGEGIISEPTMPTFNLDPPKSRKITRTASVAHTSIMSKDFH